MQQIQLELEGGGTLTVCLRASLDAMPTVKQRPLVLVVPGGGYSHVSPPGGQPGTPQFAAAGYATAVLTAWGKGRGTPASPPAPARRAGAAAAAHGGIFRIK